MISIVYDCEGLLILYLQNLLCLIISKFDYKLGCRNLIKMKLNLFQFD